MTGTREISPKIVTNNATTISIVEEAGNTFSAGDNRACSNGGSGKDRHSNDIPSAEDRRCTNKPLYYGCGQEREQELLQLWRFWTLS